MNDQQINIDLNDFLQLIPPEYLIPSQNQGIIVPYENIIIDDYTQNAFDYIYDLQVQIDNN